MEMQTTVPQRQSRQGRGRRRGRDSVNFTGWQNLLTTISFCCLRLVCSLSKGHRGWVSKGRGERRLVDMVCLACVWAKGARNWRRLRLSICLIVSSLFSKFIKQDLSQRSFLWMSMEWNSIIEIINRWMTLENTSINQLMIWWNA